jgi:hypothetical protein
MYSDTGDTTSLVPGFPIRTSSDPRSVDSSPRHIAASHVLHRLLMPRHPPCALKHLHTNKKTNTRQKRHKPPPQKRKGETQAFLLDARNHYPTLKHHTPPPKAGRQRCVASKPNSVSGDLLCRRRPHQESAPETGTFVVHPACATTATDPFTAQRSHNGTVLSWCSLERR